MAAVQCKKGLEYKLLYDKGFEQKLFGLKEVAVEATCSINLGVEAAWWNLGWSNKGLE